MVSFRFHLVSLIGVFLALALGIGMGVTVIDRATVNLLQQRLDVVGTEVDAANQRSDQLQTAFDRSVAYEEATADYVVGGRLADTPVTLIAVRGVDEGAVNELKATFTRSGALVQGTLWLTGASSLQEAQSLQAVGESLAIPGGSADQVRQAMLSRIAATFAGASEPGVLLPLIDDGVLQWQGETSRDLAAANFTDSRLVIASTAEPEVPNADVAIPLTQLLAAQPDRRLLVVEPGREPDQQRSGQRAVFVGALRNNAELDDRLSSVDNIETVAGRVTATLALSQLPERVGAYGLGEEADDGIVPAQQ